MTFIPDYGSGFFPPRISDSGVSKAQDPESATLIFSFFNFFPVLNPDADPRTPLNPNPIRVRLYNTEKQITVPGAGDT